MSQYFEAFQRQVLQPLQDERSKLPDQSPPPAVALAGSLGDAVREFVRWMAIKQTPQELAPFLSRCGDELVKLGELACARDIFYAGALDAVRSAAPTANATGAATSSAVALLPDQAWLLGVELQVAIATSRVDVAACLALDPAAKYPHTVRQLRRSLARVQAAMEALLHGLPTREHEHVSWLLLNGCVAVYSIAEPLATLGHSAAAIPFLTWCALTMEAVVPLAALPYLHFRMRLYASIAYAYDERQKHKACRNVVAHAKAQVAQLRKLEELDPPLPKRVVLKLQVKVNNVQHICFSKALSYRPEVVAQTKTLK